MKMVATKRVGQAEAMRYEGRIRAETGLVRESDSFERVRYKGTGDDAKGNSEHKFLSMVWVWQGGNWRRTGDILK